MGWTDDLRLLFEAFPPPPWRRAISRRTISLALIMTGAGLLGYVGKEYWETVSSQRRLATEWTRQTESVSASGGASTQAQVPPEQMLTRVVISKIKLDAIVVEGTSSKQLLQGPG